MMYTIHSWPRRNRTNIAQLPPPFILAPPRPENIGPIFILWRACGWHAGITHIISGGAWCTFSEPERFYSYRRDHPKNGNQAAMIWLTDAGNTKNDRMQPVSL